MLRLVGLGPALYTVAAGRAQAAAGATAGFSRLGLRPAFARSMSDVAGPADVAAAAPTTPDTAATDTKAAATPSAVAPKPKTRAAAPAPAWTDKDVKDLETAVFLNKKAAFDLTAGSTWFKVAAVFNGKFTAEQCYNKSLELEAALKTKVDAKWTDEELALLKDGMEQAKKAKKLLVKAATWDWIVKTVSLKRTGKEASKQAGWSDAGQWPKEQIQVLVDETKKIAEEGRFASIKDWKRISELVSKAGPVPRTTRQCTDMWDMRYNPNRKERPWTNHEDANLMDAVRRLDLYIMTHKNSISPEVPLAKTWTQIKKMFPYRAFRDIRSRYGYLKAKALKEDNNKEYYPRIDESAIRDELADMIYLVGYHFQKDFPLPNSLLKTPEPRPEEPPVTQTVMGKRVLLSDLYLISWHTGSSFQNRMERLFGNVVVDGVLSTTLAPSTMLLRFLMQYGSRYFNFEVMQMEKEDVVNSKTRPVAYITLNKDAASLSSFKLLAIWGMMRSQKEPQNMKAFDVFITRMILQAANDEGWSETRKIGYLVSLMGGRYAQRTIKLLDHLKTSPSFADKLEIKPGRMEGDCWVRYKDEHLEAAKKLATPKFTQSENVPDHLHKSIQELGRHGAHYLEHRLKNNLDEVIRVLESEYEYAKTALTPDEVLLGKEMFNSDSLTNEQARKVREKYLEDGIAKVDLELKALTGAKTSAAPPAPVARVAARRDGKKPEAPRPMTHLNLLRERIKLSMVDKMEKKERQVIAAAARAKEDKRIKERRAKVMAQSTAASASSKTKKK